MTDTPIEELIEWNDGGAYFWEDNGNPERANMHRQTAEALRELEETKQKYYELLYQVASKLPDETRHETAKRYIRQAENRCNGPQEQTKGGE